MQVKSKSGRAFDLPSAEQERQIQAGIAADPDTFSAEEFSTMRPRGRPRAAVTKQPVSIRLSPEVVDYFRASGKGWQTRIDDILKKFVSSHQ